MPIILILYLNPLIDSQQCFITKNSLPKVLDYTPACFFDIQYMDVELIKTINPVLGRLVTISSA